MGKLFFQWIDPEMFSGAIYLVDIVFEDNINYLVFSDGSRCAIDYVLPLGKTNSINAAVAHLENENKLWEKTLYTVGEQEEKYSENADGERVCVSPFIPGKQMIEIKAPLFSKYYDYENSLYIIKMFNNLNEDSNQEKLSETLSVTNTEKTVNSSNITKSLSADSLDPVHILIEKSKKEELLINVDITLQIPPISLYKLISNTFEDGSNKTVEYILNNIDVSMLKDSIKTGLINLYNENVTQ